MDLLEEGVEETHDIERPVRRLTHEPRVELTLHFAHGLRDVPGARSIFVERFSGLFGGVGFTSATVEDVFKGHEFFS
ncbi:MULTISPECIES: hypothetical protein [unclassified Streptomyces]|uniref:hypothetical protein n=1 Tax=unclassified Streptomyces TaxID=2593676 RepID=UPI003414D452